MPRVTVVMATYNWSSVLPYSIGSVLRQTLPDWELLVVGDGIVDGRAENAPDGIAAAGAAVGLEPLARASQARPLHDRRLAEIFAGQPRREHLLLLEKKRDA